MVNLTVAMPLSEHEPWSRRITSNAKHHVIGGPQMLAG